MARLRTLTRLVLMLTLLAMGAGGGRVAAQSLPEEGAFVSELTGLEITFSSDWDVAQSDVSPEGENELTFLESRTGLLMIGFGLTDDVENSITSTISDIDGAEMIDEGAEADFAWGLASAEQEDGSTVYIYVEAENAFVDDYQLVAGLIVEDDFVDEFELVQETVSIDGGYVFVEHEADELEELIGGGAVDADTTPDAEGNVTETGEPRGGTSAESDGESHEFVVEDLVVTVSGPVSINQVQVEEGSYEQILLLGGGALGAVSVIEGGLGPDLTLKSFIGGFVSEMDEAVEIDGGEEGDIAWVLYSVSFQGADWYLYATVDGARFDEMDYLELIMAPEEDFEEQFIEFQESVESDGDSMFAGTEIDNLLELIDAF